MSAQGASANVVPTAGSSGVETTAAASNNIGGSSGGDGVVVERCPARIGLMGNPSDGFNGKTLSILVANFAATVTLTPSDALVTTRTNRNPRVVEAIPEESL